MSEVSQSLHLLHATRASTRSIALASRIAGRIIAHNGKWVTFVPFEEDEVPIMAAAVPGVCLRWVYFEDFGLHIEFWEAGVELGRVDLKWQAGEGSVISTIQDTRLLTRGVSLPLEPFSSLVRSIAVQLEPPASLRDRAAALLELPAYQWLSPFSVLDTPLDSARQLFPEAEDVDPMSVLTN